LCVSSVRPDGLCAISEPSSIRPSAGAQRARGPPADFFPPGPVKSLQVALPPAYNPPHRGRPEGGAAGVTSLASAQERSWEMSSTMMVERTGAAMPATGYPYPGMPQYGTPTATPSSWLMVPRCTYRFEKCQGGFKVYCSCDDRTASGVVQNLCAAL